jgi:alkylation response protein AidB-like acyl-CoA dehydrogenase
MPDAAAYLRRSEEIADTLLFPNALTTDSANLVPQAHLDLLAAEGFYGVACPLDAGGLGFDTNTVAAIVERLASGCLTTTFVYLQHHSVVRTVASSPNLRDRWLADLCAGRVRSGIALGGIRPGVQPLVASRVEGGWRLDGSVPWVTGWGRIDVIMAASLTTDGRIVRALVDASASETLLVEPQTLLAANASGTVTLRFGGHFVPDERVAVIEPYVAPPANDGGGRTNGSLALGETRRCLALIGPSPLDAELDARRRQLNEASDDEMAVARAAASEMAMRAAAALVVSTGSRALTPSSQAQRLAREALFLLVFGTRPAIKVSILNAFFN